MQNHVNGGNPAPDVLLWRGMEPSSTMSPIASSRTIATRGNATDFPVMPTTLWYSDSCFGAWEVSFARHVLSRGCPYCIGSRRSWTGTVSYSFCEDLMDDWRQRNNYDPTQLETASRAVAPNHRTACPVLYRRAGGVSSPLGQMHPLGDYKMIHAAPTGAYRFSSVEVSSTAGARVAIELL